jgi:hypothetical protein
MLRGVNCRNTCKRTRQSARDFSRSATDIQEMLRPWRNCQKLSKYGSGVRRAIPVICDNVGFRKGGAPALIHQNSMLSRPKQTL